MHQNYNTHHTKLHMQTKKTRTTQPTTKCIASATHVGRHNSAYTAVFALQIPPIYLIFVAPTDPASAPPNLSFSFFFIFFCSTKQLSVDCFVLAAHLGRPMCFIFLQTSFEIGSLGSSSFVCLWFLLAKSIRVELFHFSGRLQICLHFISTNDEWNVGCIFSTCRCKRER